MDEVKADVVHDEITLNGQQGLVVEEEPLTTYEIKWRTLMAILALSVSNTCAAISNTTNTIIRFQLESLGDAALASWIANSNLLVTLAFGPVLGSLSDKFGKKWFIVVASLLGVVGSTISGSAHRTSVVIVGNVLTGMANAGCIMGIPAAQEVTPNKLRPWATGFSQAFASCAVIAGTMGAGAFVKYQTWRWSYYLNAFVYGTSAVLVAFFYHPPPPSLRRQQSRLKDLLYRVDYFGIFLFTGSIASLIIGLTWGGTTYPWSSGRIIGTLVVGCAGLVGFGLYEVFVTSEGIFDHRLFQSRNFPILLFVCVVDGMLLLGVNVLYAQQIADMFTQDPIQIAKVLTPFLVTSAFGCLPAGWIMAHTKSYRIMLVGALLWCSVFTGLMALINSSRLSWAYAFSALFGIGTAVTTVIPVTALALSVPSFLLGTAGTISISGRALGGTIGITIFTAVYNNKIGVALGQNVGEALATAGKGNLTAEVVGALLSSNPNALNLVPGVTPALIPKIQVAQQMAVAYSWKYVWIAVCVVVAANALVACSLQSVARKMNNHIESALEDSEVRKNQMGLSK
ncbi:hypothetical protein N7510_006918 [Penicillium lagena]|uniref:uncharacterized protein n=1 Tax=Penicillium lagena TaxID=94218 RepID=UPI0025418D19|nr:uncharacterized protein N7510_006918 [Penicillium lagena]KAJ5610199.1 hypothetical protein N7510_006918 [Penicillium lagena]